MSLLGVARSPTFLDSGGAVLSPCVLRPEYSERKGVVCSFHAHTLRTSNTLWFYCCRRHTPFRLHNECGVSSRLLSRPRRFQRTRAQSQGTGPTCFITFPFVTSQEAEWLIAATVMRACRNRNLSTPLTMSSGFTVW